MRDPRDRNRQYRDDVSDRHDFGAQLRPEEKFLFGGMSAHGAIAINVGCQSGTQLGNTMFRRLRPGNNVRFPPGEDV